MKRLCVLLSLICFLLVLAGCGVADQPTAGKPADQLSPEPSLPITTPTEASSTPTPLLDFKGNPVPPAEATMYSEMRQTSEALSKIVGTREAESLATGRALGPSSPEPIPTYDPRPTEVSPFMTPVTSGYIMDLDPGYPMKSPKPKNLWTGDLPDGKQVVVYAGGYHSLAEHDTTPAVGMLFVEILVPARSPGDPPRRSKDDPRLGGAVLPVGDGFARVVDARMTDTEILVYLRTEGGSTYTYEVNTHTLTQTGGPTATPLPPGASTPTLPLVAP